MTNNALAPLPDAPDFDALVDMTTRTIADSSARIYARTYAAWADWCEGNGLDLLNINGASVWDFLADMPVSHETRKRHLSAMRQLAKMLSILDYGNPARAAAYNSVQMIKAPVSDEGNARDKIVLTFEEVRAVLDAWNGDQLHEIRNNALIAVLFGSGLRRAEAVALKWADVDMETGVITVQHGKGDKRREVGILGETCIPALLRWKSAQGDGYEYVFTRINDDRRTVGADKPMSTQRLYDVVKKTVKRTDIYWRPHSARATFITEQLLNGAVLHDVQEQAGHANPAQTLEYAQSVDAAQRRKRLTVRW